MLFSLKNTPDNSHKVAALSVLNGNLKGDRLYYEKNITLFL